jgi:integrase
MANVCGLDFLGALHPQTVRLVDAMLHKAFDYAVSVGLLARNVCDIVSLPRVEKYEARSLTLEQVQQLLSSAKGHRVEALWTMVLVTSMRRGEILGLKWSDINLSTEWSLCSARPSM